MPHPSEPPLSGCSIRAVAARWLRTMRNSNCAGGLLEEFVVSLEDHIGSSVRDQVPFVQQDGPRAQFLNGFGGV